VSSWDPKGRWLVSTFPLELLEKAKGSEEGGRRRREEGEKEEEEKERSSMLAVLMEPQGEGQKREGRGRGGRHMS
jgi:hypothetical protein